MTTLKQNQTKSIATKIAKKYSPEKIILFGSFVSGKVNRDSDVDMLIIKKTRENFYDRLYHIRKIVEPDIPFDPIVFTPQEIASRQQAGDAMISEIFKTGKVLYEKRQPKSKRVV